MQLKDDTYTMVLNTACTPDKVPEGLRALYEYINDPIKCEGSILVKAIDARVQNQLYKRLLKRNRIDDRQHALTLKLFLYASSTPPQLPKRPYFAG